MNGASLGVLIRVGAYGLTLLVLLTLQTVTGRPLPPLEDIVALTVVVLLTAGVIEFSLHRYRRRGTES